MTERTYRSRVDGIIRAAVFAAPVVILLTNFAVPHGQSHALTLFLRCTGTLLMLLAIWFMLGTSYTLGKDTLLIHCGPARWRIALREIRSVRPSRDARSSPALSLDRLRIEYGAGRWILISPRERDEFVADLERRRRALE